VRKFSFNNPLKEDLCYRLINDVNTSKRFGAMFLNADKNVALRYSINCEGNFVPENIINIVVSLMTTADETYGKFMKIMYS